jgi:hypothetical protein
MLEGANHTYRNMAEKLFGNFVTARPVIRWKVIYPHDLRDIAP